MPVLTANIRKAAAESTLELPFRIPLQEWFSYRQAGAALGISESMVEKLDALGRFPVVHSHNAGRGERMHKRLHRSSVIAYAIASADYRHDEQAVYDALLTSLRHCPAARLLWLAAELRRIAMDVPPMPGAGSAPGRLQSAGKR